MTRQPIRKDPSGSRGVERIFIRALVARVRNYRVECIKFVELHHGRALEAPIQKLPIDARQLVLTIQQLAGITISQHADPIAEEAALQSYLHGKRWAEKGLSTAGVLNPKTGETKPFFLPPERRAIDKIKVRNLVEIQGMTDDLAKRMSRSLVEGFENGETMNKLIARVREVTDFGEYAAERIARTETLRAVNSAAKDRYRSAGVEKVEWLAAWDDRTCPECEGKHGNVYQIDKAPDLPVHPNCRCTLAPVIETGDDEQ